MPRRGGMSRTASGMSRTASSMSPKSDGTWKPKGEKYDNPFKIPTDDDVFQRRDAEKKQRAAERERQKNLKIWEKNPAAPYKLLVKSNIRPARTKVTPPKKIRRPQENLPDFIAKKRDMFLMQMSLNTKREEIKKLEDKAHMKEEALERSEKMLEDDASKFDEFLRKNDKEAHKAFKGADKEIKDKQEKIEELKKLNIEASKIYSEISKLKDRLVECEKYKTFLLEVSRDRRGEKSSAEGGVDQEGTSDHSEEVQTKLPFTDPEQLLGVFAQKEEENLFLIEIIQRGEEELEQLRRRYAASKEEMKAKTEEVQKNIKEIDSKINYQTSKINSLRSNPAVGDLKGENNTALVKASMRKLDGKIKAVYSACFKDLESDPLTMLKEIEVKVDTFIDYILSIPEVKRKILEQRKENERRAYNREVKKAEMERVNAERAEKAAARAKAETYKKIGKSLMPRINLKKYKKKAEIHDESADVEKLEYQKYFTDSAMT